MQLLRRFRLVLVSPLRPLTDISDYRGATLSATRPSLHLDFVPRDSPLERTRHERERVVATSLSPAERFGRRFRTFTAATLAEYPTPSRTANVAAVSNLLLKRAAEAESIKQHSRVKERFGPTCEIAKVGRMNPRTVQLADS